MRKFSGIFVLGLLALLTAPAFGQNVNVRGQITAFDGKVLSVKARDGRDLKIDVPDTVNVSGTKAFTMAEITPGMMLGVTTIKRGADTIAIDVRPIPATAGPGLANYDLQPESTMTNAAMEGAVMQGGNGQELMLNYKTGTVKVIVPPGTPMSQSAPGQRTDLKAGETVFLAARQEGDKLTATRVQVSTNGVKPTQ